MHDPEAEKKAPAAVKKIMAELRKHAMRYPQVTEDFPWGHSAMKVKGKASYRAIAPKKLVAALDGTSDIIKGPRRRK